LKHTLYELEISIRDGYLECNCIPYFLKLKNYFIFKSQFAYLPRFEVQGIWKLGVFKINDLELKFL